MLLERRATMFKHDMIPGYTILPYIDLTVAQRINTGITEEPRCTLDAQVLDLTKTGVIFGKSFNAPNSGEITLSASYFIASVGNVPGQSTTRASVNITESDTNRHVFKLLFVTSTATKGWVDNIGPSMTSVCSNYNKQNIWIGGNRSSGQTNLRVYSFKQYSNGTFTTVTNDMIPAQRNSDNKNGLYDIKINTFHAIQ